MLKLMEIQNEGDDSNLIEVSSHCFTGEDKLAINFSPDGSLFAYFAPNSNQIRVISILPMGINQLLTQISEDKFYTKFDGAKVDLSFIKTIEFDQRNKFLVGIGEVKVIVLNLESCKHQVYQIDNKIYDKILKVRLCSISNEKY